MFTLVEADQVTHQASEEMVPKPYEYASIIRACYGMFFNSNKFATDLNTIAACWFSTDR